MSEIEQAAIVFTYKALFDGLPYDSAIHNVRNLQHKATTSGEGRFIGELCDKLIQQRNKLKRPCFDAKGR